MAKFNLYPKIKDLKLLILDVDGVFTQGGITYISGENTSRRFDVKDGLGLVVMAAHDFKLAIITGKKNEMVKRRAEILGISDVFQSFPHKSEAYEQLKKKYKFADHECAFIGDDLIDIAVLRQVGFGVAVADAHPAAKQVADYITFKPGGSGAIREVVDLILSFKSGEFSRNIPIPEKLATRWKINKLA
ncbi:MAG: KdsC family phosphatase [Candidatus Zixiibacteriota bacterium]